MSARVLAVCTGGGIGDLLAATPAMSALARHFDSPVTALVSPYAKPMLEDHPAIASVMVDDGRRPFEELLKEVKAGGFTHAVVFWSNPRVASLVWRAGIPVRAGQSRRLYSFLYTVRVPVRTESGDASSHWTDVQMDYARALGAQPRPDDFKIDIAIRPRDDAEAQAVLQAAGVHEPFVVWHAARGLSPDRVEWPAEAFAAVGDALGKAFDARVVLSGSADDAASLERVASAMSVPNVSLAGKTSLRGLAALLARATVVVALDSGPMHIAAAVGAPTVGIFALRTDLPKRWRPLGPRAVVIEPSYPCPAWCRKETCRTFACYRALSSAAIVAAAQQICTAPPMARAAAGS